MTLPASQAVRKQIQTHDWTQLVKPETAAGLTCAVVVMLRRAVMPAYTRTQLLHLLSPPLRPGRQPPIESLSR